jgi:hypothetical protein
LAGAPEPSDDGGIRRDGESGASEEATLSGQATTRALPVSLAARGRLAVGLACVAVAVVALVWKAPQVFNALNASVRADSYVQGQEGRSLTVGDGLGIPYDLQVAALTDIPKGSGYAVLLPPTAQAAAARNIPSLAYGVVPAWLEYLLLPDTPAPPAAGRYLICWGCNTAPWDSRTTWIWQGQGASIGLVRR